MGGSQHDRTPTGPDAVEPESGGQRTAAEPGKWRWPRTACFQGEPVAPPTLSTVGPAGAYVIGSTSTPFVRASQCTCGPVDTPLEPTEAIRSPPTTRSPSSTFVPERW